MPWKTPEEEAAHALRHGVSRSELSMGGQLAYDQIKAAYEPGSPDDLTSEPTHRIPGRTPSETRARILEMFKRVNTKYSKPLRRTS
jgi:hypothetical protein